MPCVLLLDLQVERLASGLRHEPAFVASALDVSSSEAATFVSNMLQVDSVPSVLLYPEAARGCLKFLGALLLAEQRFPILFATAHTPAVLVAEAGAVRSTANPCS
jgi:hypothetical protein